MRALASSAVGPHRKSRISLSSPVGGVLEEVYGTGQMPFSRRLTLPRSSAVHGLDHERVVNAIDGFPNRLS